MARALAEVASRDDAEAVAAVAAAEPGSAAAAEAEEALRATRARHAATEALLQAEQEQLAQEAQSSLQGALRIALGLRTSADTHRAIAQAAGPQAQEQPSPVVGVAG
jgi:hypothetical protein